MRTWLFLALVAVGASACGASDDSDASRSMGGGGTDYSPAPAANDTNGGGTVVAGILTAGAWDDNRNYEFFKHFLASHAGLSGAPPIESADRDSAISIF